MNYNLETELIHRGNHPEEQGGYVSPPLFRGSTVLYRTIQEMQESANDKMKMQNRVYGRFGSPNSRNFESVLAGLENGFGTVCTVSGLSAITTAIMTFVQTGDHLLVSDSVYFPTRRFCDSLARFGITTEYFDPCLGAEIATKLRPETRLVFLESPGSMTFEIQDIPTIAKVCRARGVISLIDNTWATPLFFKPLDFGVNISIHSATKYITGHADSFLGAIVCDQSTYAQVRSTAIDLGQKAGAEDVHLALRGLRTLSVRLKQHDENGRALANWLQTQPEVESVCHPALPSHPQHHLWKRDFTGACGLFSFQFKTAVSKESIGQFVNALKIFGIGHSWGGFESLIAPVQISEHRQFIPDQQEPSRSLRLHAGLESVEDLKEDLTQAFQVLR